jgi:hypothetical protein
MRRAHLFGSPANSLPSHLNRDVLLTPSPVCTSTSHALCLLPPLPVARHPSLPTCFRAFYVEHTRLPSF